MNVHQRLASQVLILFLALVTAGPAYTRSQHTIADTLQPEPVKDSIGQTSSGTINASHSVVRNQPDTKKNRSIPPNDWRDTLFGVIVTGVATIGIFILGFTFLGAKDPLIGSLVQLMGIAIILIAGIMTVQFFRRLKSYKARKALEKRTIDG